MQLSNSLTPKSISSSGYLLRQYDGAAAAYSLQRLDTSTENVVRARRSTDDAEADFTAQEVSGGSLREFSLNNDADLIRFADQATAADKRMYFDGVNDYVSVAGMGASGSYFGACTITATVNFDDPSARGVLCSLGTSAYRVFAEGGTWRVNSSDTLVSVPSGIHTVSVDFNSSGQATELRIDGVTEWTGTISAGATAVDVFYVGGRESGGSVGLLFKGLIYDFSLSGSSVKNFAFNGYGNTNADWEDQVGSNDGTVVGSPALFSGQGFDAFVTTWYDQSGNGRNATQATAASQPQIVADGVVVTDSNGNPAMLFDGTDDSLVTASFSAAQPITTFVKFSYTVASNAVFDGTGANRHLLDETGGNWRIFAGAGLVGGAVDTNENVGAALYNSTSSSLYINGSSQVSGNAGTQGINAGLRLGTNNGSADPLNGSLSEFALYASDKSSDRASIEANIAARYGITLS